MRHEIDRGSDDGPYCTCGNHMEWEDCYLCGGDGHREYVDSPDEWGEDCPSEVNHLVTCRECDGYGGWYWCPKAASESASVTCSNNSPPVGQ